LVMEYMDGGELENSIPLPEHEARYVFLQLVLGLRYIHSQGVVHRDLKPQNVLINRGASHSDLLEVKISDFGHSKILNDGYSSALTVVGTKHYWAPEVTRAEKSGYDQRVDLWSLGVMLHFMIEGSFPPDAPAALRYTSETRMSRGAFEMVRGLIQVNPQHRWTLGHCLKHPWLMMTDGILSKVVLQCDVCQRRASEEQDRCAYRAVLPREPNDVRQLRRDFQVLITQFKMPIRLLGREVSLRCDSDMDETRIDAAWAEVEEILRRHFPDETCGRIDVCAAVGIGVPLETLEEVPDTVPSRCELGLLGSNAQFVNDEPSPEVQLWTAEPAGPGTFELSPISMATPASMLDIQDQEVEELMHVVDLFRRADAWWGWALEAEVGEHAPVPRRVVLRRTIMLGCAHVLQLSSQLHPGYPTKQGLEKVDLSIKPKYVTQAAEDDAQRHAVGARARLGDWLCDAGREARLLRLFAWLQEGGLDIVQVSDVERKFSHQIESAPPKREKHRPPKVKLKCKQQGWR